MPPKTSNIRDTREAHATWPNRRTELFSASAPATVELLRVARQYIPACDPLQANWTLANLER